MCGLTTWSRTSQGVRAWKGSLSIKGQGSSQPWKKPSGGALETLTKPASAKATHYHERDPKDPYGFVEKARSASAANGSRLSQEAIVLGGQLADPFLAVPVVETSKSADAKHYQPGERIDISA